VVFDAVQNLVIRKFTHTVRDEEIIKVLNGRNSDEFFLLLQPNSKFRRIPYFPKDEAIFNGDLFIVKYVGADRIKYCGKDCLTVRIKRKIK